MRKSLITLEGVYKAVVDLDEKTAMVFYDPAKVDIADITKAPTDRGFPSSVKSYGQDLPGLN